MVAFYAAAASIVRRRFIHELNMEEYALTPMNRRFVKRRFYLMILPKKNVGVRSPT